MLLTIKPTARGILRRQVLDQLSGIGDIHLLELVDAGLKSEEAAP